MDEHRPQSFLLKRLLASPTLLALLVSAALIGGAKLPALQPLPENPAKLAGRLSAAGMHAEAEAAYRELLAADPAPTDPDLHFEYIRNHFSIPDGPRARRDDAALFAYYASLAGEGKTASLGAFGLGWAHALQGDYPAALARLAAVPDRGLKYLNYAAGYAHLKLGERAAAEGAFRREINLGGAQPAAAELAKLYLDTGDFDRLADLAADPRTGSHLGSGTLRKLAYHTQDWAAYLRLVFLAPFRHVSLVGGLSALIICLVWLIYLVRIAVFREKPFRYYLVLLSLGAVFACASLVLSDALEIALPKPAQSAWWQSLVGAVVKIGAVEELVKFLPVLIVVALTRRVEEPFDLVLYGTLSALGFATLENALYFSQGGLGIALSRFVLSTVVHVGLTGLVCYAWAGARHIRGRRPLPAILGGFALAALLHGLFDYFLMTGEQSLVFFSYAIAFVVAREYHRMAGNALNFSPYFDEARPVARRLRNFDLFLPAAILFLPIGYLYYNFDYTTAIANRQLAQSCLSALPAAIAVVGSLGQLKLARGQLKPLNNFRGRRLRREREALPAAG